MSVLRVARAALPSAAVLLVALLIVTYVPWLVGQQLPAATYHLLELQHPAALEGQLVEPVDPLVDPQICMLMQMNA